MNQKILALILVIISINFSFQKSEKHLVDNEVFYEITGLPYKYPWYSGFLEANYTV